MPERIIGLRYFVTFLIMGALTLPFLGRGLYESSEGRYAKVAQNMIESGDYLIPRLNKVEHLTKPPLTYWIIAAGLKIFGHRTFGARFFHTLMWLTLGLIVVRMGDLIESPKLGLLTGIIFSTSWFSSLGPSALTTDPVVVFLQAIMLWSLLEEKSHHLSLWALLFWLALGLAFSTKGPVAIMPLIFWIWFFKNEFKTFLKSHLWIVAIGAGCFWYILLEIRMPGILKKLIWDEIILRTTTDHSGRNPMWWAPFLVYFLPLLLGQGTWILYFRKQHLLKGKPEWAIMMLVWINISLLFFCLVQSRLILYILPLTIPCAILMALSLRDLPLRKIINIASINIVILFALKTYGTFFLKSDANAEEIASFIDENSHHQEVNLFDEERLFGVDFYYHGHLKKLSYEETYSYLLKQKNPEFYFFTKNKRSYFEDLANPMGLKIKTVSTMGKWELVEVDNPKLELSKK